MTINTLFIDIDGTLLVREEPVPGAAEAVLYARDRGLALRFLTNINARTPKVIAQQLRDKGIEVEASEIHTATSACILALKQRPNLRCHLLVPDSIRAEFNDVLQVEEDVQAVVIADMGEAFGYSNLNQVFRMVLDGAEMFVMQKGLFWNSPKGPCLDSGAFVLGIEAATGKSAQVMGKPSLAFIQTALDDCKVSADQVLVIGDDVTTDICSAALVGAQSVLVGTGKYRVGHEAAGPHRPDHFLTDISALPMLLAATQTHLGSVKKIT